MKALLPRALIFLVPLAIVTGNACAQAGPNEADNAVHLSDAAMKDYMLNCAGCHRFDGRGAEKLGIPDFRHRIGVFTHLPEGREYMVRVPGSAQSQLSDADLARVLNWIIVRYDPEHAARPFQGFTADEVSHVRSQRYDDVARERHALTSKLEAMGLTPAPYTYGAGKQPTP